MVPAYVGNLSLYDPLYDYLCDEILPQLEITDGSWASRVPYHPDFRVYRLAGSHEVYLYVEQHYGIHVIGKFFGSSVSDGSASYGARREFFRLQQLRRYGFAGPVYYVPRPLGRNRALNDVLIEEYREGVTLTCLLLDAMASGQYDRLLDALSALAAFLAALHNRTTGECPVNFHEDCDYLDKLVSQLVTGQNLNTADAEEFSWLRERWREQPHMWTDRQVLVHGDTTPGNFLFREDLRMTAVDLERARCADRVVDLGRITGEIQHFFLRASGNRYAAEPFIGHFLRAYVHALPEGDAAFRSITSRLPFHMGTTLLRIARNSWVSIEYRRMLIEEAKHSLRAYALDT